MSNLKNCYVLWHKTNRIGSYSFDPYDTETIDIADNNLQRDIDKAFGQYPTDDLYLMKYDEKGECSIRVLQNPKPKIDVKLCYVFNFSITDNSNYTSTIAVFDTKEIAKNKIADYLQYNYDFFEKDEIEVMTNDLITCGEFTIDNVLYTFKEFVVNKC